MVTLQLPFLLVPLFLITLLLSILLPFIFYFSLSPFFCYIVHGISSLLSSPSSFISSFVLYFILCFFASSFCFFLCLFLIFFWFFSLMTEYKATTLGGYTSQMKWHTRTLGPPTICIRPKIQTSRYVAWWLSDTGHRFHTNASVSPILSFALEFVVEWKRSWVERG